MPCSGKPSVELDSIPPQDLAQGGCGVGEKCGEAASDAERGIEQLLSMALQQQESGSEADAGLTKEDMDLLSKLKGGEVSEVTKGDDSDAMEEAFKKALMDSNVL